MKTYRFAWLIVAAAISVTAAYPQTAAELMQKGIYTQETAGDLDGAIAIYRQIVNSGSAPRDLAAQAQYRLAQSLLQKGDLGNAATEFNNLARNYADYGRLVSSMAATARGAVPLTAYPGRGSSPEQVAELERMMRERQMKLAQAVNQLNQAESAGGRADVDKAKAQLAEMQARLAEINGAAVGEKVAGLFNGVSYDGGAPVTVKGVVVEALWVNPTAVIMLDPADGSGKTYAFQMASPNTMMKQGWTRQTVRVEDQLTVTAVLAAGNATIQPSGAIAGLASTITAADGRKLFDRSAIQK